MWRRAQKMKIYSKLSHFQQTPIRLFLRRISMLSKVEHLHLGKYMAGKIRQAVYTIVFGLVKLVFDIHLHVVIALQYIYLIFIYKDHNLQRLCISRSPNLANNMKCILFAERTLIYTVLSFSYFKTTKPYNRIIYPLSFLITRNYIKAPT